MVVVPVVGLVVSLVKLFRSELRLCPFWIANLIDRNVAEDGPANCRAAAPVAYRAAAVPVPRALARVSLVRPLARDRALLQVDFSIGLVDHCGYVNLFVNTENP